MQLKPYDLLDLHDEKTCLKSFKIKDLTDLGYVFRRIIIAFVSESKLRKEFTENPKTFTSDYAETILKLCASHQVIHDNKETVISLIEKSDLVDDYLSRQAFIQALDKYGIDGVREFDRGKIDREYLFNTLVYSPDSQKYLYNLLCVFLDECLSLMWNSGIIQFKYTHALIEKQ